MRLTNKLPWDDPLVGYLDRHPTSRIQKWLPGLTLAPAVTRVEHPDNGLGDEPLYEWLSMLSFKGVLSMKFPQRQRVPGTLMTLMKYGIHQKCEYKYLPLPDQPIGWKVINSQFSGYLEFYERERLAIVSYGDDDEIIPETDLWHLMPDAFLRDVLRMRGIRKTPGFEETSLEHIAEYYRAYKLHRTGLEVPPTPPATPPLGETEDDRVWSLSLAEYLSGLWRDLHPDSGPEILPSILGRIQRKEDGPFLVSQPTDQVEDSFDDPFGARRWEVNEDEVNSDESEEGFNPWDALDAMS